MQFFDMGKGVLKGTVSRLSAGCDLPCGRVRPVPVTRLGIRLCLLMFAYGEKNGEPE